MTDLLAKDGTADNQRQGRLGILLHDLSKWAIRKAIQRERKRIQPVLDYYASEHGEWLNPDIKQLYEDFNWLISLEELPNQYGGFQKGEDVNRDMFHDLRDIMCVHLDQDTHYHLRFMALIYRIHANWPAYEIACTRAFHFLDVTAKRLGMTFEEVYQNLDGMTKPNEELPDEGQLKGEDSI
jgi:hypothetical protein